MYVGCTATAKMYNFVISLE